MRNTLTLEKEEKKMAETIGMVLDRIEAQQAKELEALPHDHTALQLGQALYRCRSLSWRDRWRVGRDLLPYETPKLAVTAQVSEQSFAELLERRIKKLDAMNGNPQPQPQIDHTTEQTIEASKPLPRLNDRRYRRI
jgi:hypothetical protein